MSKAGQNNLTGISVQADITLFYLLNALNRTDFRQIIIEGKEWEDFTLVFDSYKEDFEVKWHSKPLSYSEIHKIIKKEIKKRFSEEDKLKIVARKISIDYQNKHRYICNSLPWWLALREKNPHDNPIFKKFIEKGWAEDEIAFLLKTELREMQNESFVKERIMEFFAFEDQFYLDEEDMKNVISRSFQTILKKGARGETITKQEFIGMLVQFKESIEKKSESFSKNPIFEKIGNINKFFSSERDFLTLNDPKYLSPISATPRLIFFITDELKKTDFKFSSWKFFLEKILLKRSYLFTAMTLLKVKWDDKKISNKQILEFIIENFGYLYQDYNYIDSLNIIIQIARNDDKRIFRNKIITFLKKNVLIKFKEQKIKTEDKKRKYSEFREEIAELIEILYENATNKKKFIDFIFEYFDLTVIGFSFETPAKIFEIILKYLKRDVEKNLKPIVSKISDQYNFLYKGKYKGYEWTGGSVGWGKSYAVNDIKLVSHIFQPLFNEMYESSKQNSWKFFKKNILDCEPNRPTADHPLYLKRSLVGILINRAADNSLNSKDSSEAFEHIKKLLKIKRGIPGTSEVVFQALSGANISKFEADSIMVLIKIDESKYGKITEEIYPTNLFTIKVLFSLIKNDYEPAKNHFLSLAKQPKFHEMDKWYNSFELMHQMEIDKNDPEFASKFLNIIDFDKYLDSSDRFGIWDNKDIFVTLIKKDWRNGTDFILSKIKKLLSKKIQRKKVLDFFSGIIHDLSKIDPLKTYELIEPYFKNTTVYNHAFGSNPSIRENIGWLAEELIKIKKFDLAMKLIELNYQDPDPVTDSFDLHEQVKNGAEVASISTVRGIVGWVLRYFSAINIPKYMKFSYEKTLTLLDLDGDLAKKLGYKEPDDYVRQMALINLEELSNLSRRKLLNNYESGLGDRIKITSFDILETLASQIDKTQKIPKGLLIHLTRVFANIRDLNTNEAKIVVDFFLQNKITEGVFLLIYFALFREKQFEEIPFKSQYFKDQLMSICETENIYREQTALQFYRLINEEKKGRYQIFLKIEKYWKLLFSHYDRKTYNILYKTLAYTLKWESKYQAYVILLKDAISRETEFLRKTKSYRHSRFLDPEIFQILFDKDKNDFLEVFYLLIKNLDENTHIYNIDSLIYLYESIKPRTKHQKKLINDISKRLHELYPEKYL
jgi:hypothetical protein